MIPESFHFLRPAWLWALGALVPALWLATRRARAPGAWGAVCDAGLLRQLRVEEGARSARWPRAALALGWAFACVALAGPTWERLPQPAYREPMQTLVVLDLSPAMTVRDEKPSRLARARYAANDALERVEGAVGLAVYAEEAYPVTPLTDDPRVIAATLPVLSPDLMPGRGARLDRGLDEAVRLLGQAGAAQGRILVIAAGPGERPDEASAAAARAAAAGYPVSALGVGGDADTLATVARAGGGRYSPVRLDGVDLDVVLADPVAFPGFGPLEESGLRGDAWRDAGAWLLLIPLALAPLAFRRGWVGALGLGLLVSLDPGAATAAPADWFARPDQRAADAFEAGRHDEAAALFEDPAWRVAALYRAGDYAGAVEAHRSDPTSLDPYNLGNALARAGQLEAAVEAYDRALEVRPDDGDARYNRDLVQKLLDERQNQQQPKEGQEQKQDQQQGQDRGQQQSPEQQQDASSGSGGQTSETDESSSGADSSEGSSSPQPSSSEDDGDESGESKHDGSKSGPSDRPNEGSQDREASESAEPGGRDGREPWSSQAASPKDATGAQAPDASGDPAEMAADANEQEPSGPGARARGPLSEADQEAEQWLNRVPDDPGGLLREKLRRRYLEKQASARTGGLR